MKGSSRWVAAAAAAATLLFTGCSGGSEPHPADGATVASSAVAQPVTCHVGIKVPGFRVIARNRVPQDDRIGMSVRLRDDAGHKLIMSAGVPGDFAEGAASLGQVAVRDGLEGQLYGAGSVWVLTWDEQGACGPHAAIGNDVSKHGFIVAMTRAGVMRPGD